MSVVRTALILEIQDLMKRSLVISNKLKNARSDMSKAFYTKKIKKNNKILSTALEALERIPPTQSTATPTELESNSTAPPTNES